MKAYLINRVIVLRDRVLTFNLYTVQSSLKIIISGANCHQYKAFSLFFPIDDKRGRKREKTPKNSKISVTRKDTREKQLRKRQNERLIESWKDR